MNHSKVSAFIDTYLEGWKMGDGELSLSATASNFTYDDPNTGTILRANFVTFMNDFKADAVAMGAKENAKPFLNYTDTVITMNETGATVWCWWHAVGTELQGCALIKVDEEGVQHEKIAYFSKLP